MLRHGLLVTISIAVALLAAEFSLRLAGFEPWRYYIMDAREPTVQEFHSELGWRNRPGVYTVPAYSSDEKNITISFLEDGRRKTHESQGKTTDNRPKMIFVGDSFTQGWAISDHETFPWKIQLRFPMFEVLNYGTAAYSTYQSLLMLEKILPEVRPRAEIVVYGIIGHHVERNVASAEWLRILSRFSKRNHVYLPYATVDSEGELIRHEPIRYISLPLKENLALVDLAQKAYMESAGKTELGQRESVTLALLAQMARYCKESSTEFVVAVLWWPNQNARQSLIEYLRKTGIMVVDCHVQLSSEMRVRNEGHPNDMANSHWAECIGDFIATKVLQNTGKNKNCNP